MVTGVRASFVAMTVGLLVVSGCAGGTVGNDNEPGGGDNGPGGGGSGGSGRGVGGPGPSGSGTGGSNPGTGGSTGTGGARIDGGPQGPGGSPAGGTGGAGGTTSATDGGPAISPLPDGGGLPATIKPHASNFIFDDTQLRTYTLTVTAANLKQIDDWIKQTPPKEEYVRASLKIDDEDVGEVGLRYKGAFGTLISCIVNGQIVCPKMSYKVKFDEYSPVGMEKRVYGLKRLNFHAQRADATHLHERLGYKLFRDMGVHAPRSVHGKVFINGEYRGLYAVTEAPDGRFIDARFPKGDDEGNIYKEAWPKSTDVNYYRNLQKTNEGVVPPTKVIKFANALRTATGPALTQLIDSWMGLDYMAKLLAVDRAITNWDGALTFYWGNPHNFYFYESQMTDKLWLIPWDLDNTFALFHWTEALGTWDKIPSSCALRTQGMNQYMPPGCDKILQGVASGGRARYVAAVNQLLAGPFNVERMQAQLDTWSAQIAPAVMMDTKGPGHARWVSSLATFKRDLPLLRQKIEAVRDNKDVLPYQVRLGQVSTFESVPQLNFLMGVTNGANSKSVVTHALNQTDPIGGASDVRVTFEMRNSSDDAMGALTQRAYVRLMFNEPQVNLQPLRALNVKLKADATRVVRIELNSSKYKTMVGPSSRFGWDVTVGPGVTNAALELSKLAVSPGVVNPGHVLSEIIQNATGLYVIALPNGRGANGLLAAGTADTGWFQLDDVQPAMQ